MKLEIGKYKANFNEVSQVFGVDWRLEATISRIKMDVIGLEILVNKDSRSKLTSESKGFITKYLDFG